jgi:tRNA pseudouridine38-40 synthase
MPNYRLDLAYDGSSFYGYAIQKDRRTVQGELERALRPHTGGATTYVAGRTDRGVHALDQVVSFESRHLDTEEIIHSLNSQLGPDIAVRRLVEVPDGFHARFSATGRAYRYRILNSEIHDPFRSATTWHVRDALALDAMNEAVDHLIGEHDFAALCRRYRDRSTVRFIEWARWHRDDDEVILSIGAAAFCHQLVRSVVALTTDVGRGLVDAGDIPGVLASKDRSTTRGVAPPHGLTLVAVSYGNEDLPRPLWANGNRPG